MTEEEFRAIMKEQMHGALSPIVTQMTHLLSDAYEKGLLTGLELGQKIMRNQAREELK